jgi:hypothetical protein
MLPLLNLKFSRSNAGDEFIGSSNYYAYPKTERGMDGWISGRRVTLLHPKPKR